MPTPAYAEYKIAQQVHPRAIIRYSNEQKKSPKSVFKILAKFFGYEYYGKHKARFRKWVSMNEAKVISHFPDNHPIWK